HTRHATRQWLTVVTLVTLVTLVAMGMGVALVPASLAQVGVKGVRFVPLANLRHPTVGVLAWHQEAVSPALRTFLDVAAAGRH
ncbi:MAG: LysR family transcriptional regulator, partial [Burkholderiaceae bacterium]|nr:LysR family transcriptional regulator [Burkholderiaceae bacterium]